MEHLEIERKFRISELEHRGLADKLEARGFAFVGTVHELDTFLPTDKPEDMMRIRVETDSQAVRRLITTKIEVTVQGGGRERQEREEEIGELTASCLLSLGQRLAGGRPLPSLRKTPRRNFQGILNGRSATAVLDQVEGIGAYSGYYLEIEVLAPLGSDVSTIGQEILAFAAALLGDSRQPEELSYMKMLKASLAGSGR